LANAARFKDVTCMQQRLLIGTLRREGERAHLEKHALVPRCIRRRPRAPLGARQRNPLHAKALAPVRSPDVRVLMNKP
jgi:hypothetical protein